MTVQFAARTGSVGEGARLPRVSDGPGQTTWIGMVLHRVAYHGMDEHGEVVAMDYHARRQHLCSASSKSGKSNGLGGIKISTATSMS